MTAHTPFLFPFFTMWVCVCVHTHVSVCMHTLVWMHHFLREGHTYMRMHVKGSTVNDGNHPQSLLHLIHWVRVSGSDSELAYMARPMSYLDVKLLILLFKAAVIGTLPYLPGIYLGSGHPRSSPGHCSWTIALCWALDLQCLIYIISKW